MKNIIASLKLILLSLLVCCGIYPLTILFLAQTLVSDSANGSLVYDPNGQIVGSHLIAQGFSTQSYFWPRPSAVDYNASGAGGSNLAPGNPELIKRVNTSIQSYGAPPIPADLLTASGSGLDPHISAETAHYQAARVAGARGISENKVKELITSVAVAPGLGKGEDKIVNVLMLNIALDQLK